MTQPARRELQQSCAVPEHPVWQLLCRRPTGPNTMDSSSWPITVHEFQLTPSPISCPIKNLSGWNGLDTDHIQHFKKNCLLKMGTVCHKTRDSICKSFQPTSISISEGKFHQVKKMFLSIWLLPQTHPIRLWVWISEGDYRLSKISKHSWLSKKKWFKARKYRSFSYLSTLTFPFKNQS